MAVIKKEYLPGDVVYNNVTVPEGVVIEESYDSVQNYIVIICNKDGRKKSTHTMHGVNEDDPFEVFSRDEMKRKIISGFIELYRKRK